MAIFNLFKLTVAVLALTGVVAHPNLSKEELVEYQALVARNTEVLGRCLQSRELVELNTHLQVERNITFHRLRETRGIPGHAPALPRNKYDLAKWLKVSHYHQHQSKDPQDIFHFKWRNAPKGDPAGCILTPESIYGPFWAERQPLRQDIREGQKGVYFRLAIQVIDLNTCKPLQGDRVDVWHANAVGTYDGKNTGFLRGAQWTSNHGTVDFDTIFPGHYPGRTTHIHVAVRAKDNKRVVHVGQLYFDEFLREAVETHHNEYKKNKVPYTPVDKDDFAPSAATDKYDPFVQWAYLGTRWSDGILGWIAMGVNLTANVPQPGSPKAK